MNYRRESPKIKKEKEQNFYGNDSFGVHGGAGIQNAAPDR